MRYRHLIKDGIPQTFKLGHVGKLQSILRYQNTLIPTCFKAQDCLGATLNTFLSSPRHKYMRPVCLKTFSYSKTLGWMGQIAWWTNFHREIRLLIASYPHMSTKSCLLFANACCNYNCKSCQLFANWLCRSISACLKVKSFRTWSTKNLAYSPGRHPRRVG